MNNIMINSFLKSSDEVKPEDLQTNKEDVLDVANKWSTNPLKGFNDALEGGAKKLLKKFVKSRYSANELEKNLTLTQLSCYMAAFFFDMRNIHFQTTGDNFYIYHELAQELYEQAEDFYDDLVETAIGYGEDVGMMNDIPEDWNIYNAFTIDVSATKTAIASKIGEIYDKINSVKEGYDSFVYSKLDNMAEFFDKEMYKITQALK